MFVKSQLAIALAAVMLGSIITASAQTDSRQHRQRGPYAQVPPQESAEYVPPFRMGSNGLVVGGPYGSDY